MERLAELKEKVMSQISNRFANPSATEHATGQTFIGSLHNSQEFFTPYRHWLLSNTLPDDVAQAITELPWPPPVIEDTHGAREANNATRTHFTVERRARYKVCDLVAQAFQSREVTSVLEQTCDVDLTGTSLRIEYCQDSEGFWLGPHTDIGVKKLTLQIYLSKERGSQEWGTDLLDGQKNLVRRAPSVFNAGMMFIPGPNTWHAFAKRPIQGVRKSILINYVGPEWRARHELCFPDQPVSRSIAR
jgi:hypothetical protein